MNRFVISVALQLALLMALLLGLLIELLLAPPTAQAELAAQLTLTSRYLHRGINYSGDSPAAQLLVEYDSDIGVYVGIWSSTVEWPWDDRRFEVDYFAGYQRRLNSAIALDATVIRYTYEGGGVSSDYNWTEGRLTAHLFDHWSVTVSRANNWAGRDEATGTVEGSYRYALAPRWLLDASVGHADVSAVAGFNYQWGEVGLSRQFGPLQARLAYAATHGAERWGDLAKNRWLFALGWQPGR